ncbi:MAG: phosphotransferase system enzyme I (PtsI) [Planctomycetota bacterium]|jgi:phosphotransferase system enzyme I (PtsI)
MNTPILQGTSVSPGLALGPVHVVHAGASEVPTWTVRRDEVPLEMGRLADALTATAEQLEKRERLVAASSGEKDAGILAVHRMILQDPEALQTVERTIADERINAEAAVQKLIARFAHTMGALEGDSVRSYASDVSDPWRQVLDTLLERDRQEVLQSHERVIVAAAELTPKVLTWLERDQVLAVVCESGGRFSHGAVLARSFGVPCVVGVSNLLNRLEQGAVLTVDGGKGEVQLRPSEVQLAEFRARQEVLQERAETLKAELAHSATTPDGETLAVGVNIESVREMDVIDLNFVESVGLLRTEFLFMERSQFPSEEEQYRLYRRVIEQLDGKPATLRLLDIGGDKPLPYFSTPAESNPALGWRGIRITLQWRDLLRVQLRAMLRASVAGDLRILIPMVTSLGELREVHSIFNEVRVQLTQQGYETRANVPVGCMIEVPAALYALDQIAAEADFLSVGTNDLVQYLLAVDRDNPWVASLYEPRHPAVFKALAQIAAAARRQGKSATVCGDMASDPAVSVLLLGLGFDGVSMASQFVPEVKYALRRVSAVDAKALAQEACNAELSEGVQAVIATVQEKISDAAS